MTYVYPFDHDHDRPPRELKALLGGKGADLAEMTSVLGLPVPPGFTITTAACRAYLESGWPDTLDAEIDEHIGRLETITERRLGDATDPLLVSVRSGAPSSMPGMMDTVLNLGLNDDAVEGLAKQTDERFAYDSYRRFIALYGRIVLGSDEAAFEDLFDAAKDLADAPSDDAVPAELLRFLVNRYLHLTGQPFPQDPRTQLRQAIEAVFRSWNGHRAVTYRAREHVADDTGTAVNVQAMVFGNRDDSSGTGVGFTRDPASGARGSYGDFLVNAQGEDVVAGIRETLPLAALGDTFPKLYEELLDIFDRLEHHYRDMLDTEFTIEQGKLWMLQTRVGKRTGRAALRMAVDMTSEPDIDLTRVEAVSRVMPDHLDQVLHPAFGVGDRTVLTTGLGASPGAGVGRVYFESDDVVAAVQRGETAVLVRTETSPEDVEGMQVSQAVVTSRGGLVSHAAVVARAWGIPVVVGASSLKIERHQLRVDDIVVHEGDWLSVDGTTGELMLGQLPLTTPELPPELATICEWADDIRRGRLGVRANADSGADAALARANGAEGIGLCRTEHMFLGARLPLVQRMILAQTPEQEASALEELLELQRSDFEQILEAMDGLPVTVRLLDPPLHEFLPDIEELVAKDAVGDLDEAGQALFAAARSWQEVNPMLGTRGVRLGVLRPMLYRTQVRAVVEAAGNRLQVGGNPMVEIMVPLIVDRTELALVRGWIEEEIEAVRSRIGAAPHILIGTMIETPRAALRGADIVEVADFFSFGTNDLTQLVYGFSRDDVEGRLMTRYLEEGLLPRNPFESLDREGVGELIQQCVERARKVKPELKVGVCGEHGGDPDSIALFAGIGIDYVSCSPYRVPAARLAAAHAILAIDGGEGLSRVPAPVRP